MSDDETLPHHYRRIHQPAEQTRLAAMRGAEVSEKILTKLGSEAGPDPVLQIVELLEKQAKRLDAIEQLQQKMAQALTVLLKHNDEVPPPPPRRQPRS